MANETFDMMGDQGIEFGSAADDGYAIGWRYRARGIWWVDSGEDNVAYVQDDFGTLVRRVRR